MATEQLRRQGTPLPARDILEKQLIERMITKRTLLQYTRQTGLRVSDTDLDRAIDRIAQENKLTPATLRETVERDGIPFLRFREDVRAEMLVARLRDREVESRVVVTDDEIQSFLRSQGAQGEKVDEYNLAHILVAVPEQATPEEVKARRARADTALAQIRQGADFRQVAASFSDAPDAFQGGDMGWRQAARLPSHLPAGGTRLEARTNQRRPAQSSRLSYPQAGRQAWHQQPGDRDADACAPHPDPPERGGVGERCQEPPDRPQGPHRARCRLRRAGASAFGRYFGWHAAAIWAGSPRGTWFPSSSTRWMRSSRAR